MIFFIPQGEGKHPIESLQTIFTPLLECVDDDFAISSGAKHMSSMLQFLAQNRIVIDLPVVDEPELTVLIAHRLSSVGGEVDNSESPMSQANRPLYVKPRIVRS